jgi:hypothetical protein
MVETFFTPKEVNLILPKVKEIVTEILSRARDEQGEERIKALIFQLEGMGCYYKDWNFEIGLVDFPAIIHGQQALLCWRSDEPQVEWFHGYEDGYAGRQRVTKELIFS